MVEGKAEGSSQTFPTGTLLVLASGYITQASAACHTSIYGVAVSEGQNLAADGDALAEVYRLVRGEAFVATLNGTWAASYRGATCAISQDSNGSVVLCVGTDVSGSSAAHMQDAVAPFTIGDSYPLVTFVPFDATIQGAA
jgi:hypothetical protein